MSSEIQVSTVERVESRQPLVFLINVDWYFLLHWKDRATAAKNSGWDVWVVTHISEEKYRAEILALGFQVIDVPISRHSLNPLTELRALARIVGALRKSKPALVHSVTIKPICYSLAMVGLFRAPVVLSFPGLGKLRSRGLVSRSVWGFLKLLLKLAGSRAKLLATFENYDDRTFTSSRGLTFSGVEIFPGAGIDLEKYPLLEQSRDATTIRVLFAARLLKSKGIMELEKAVDALVKEGYRVQLLVAGITDNSHSDSLTNREVQDLKKKSHVDWLGQVDDMVSVFETSDIVCLPTSYGEGVPRVLIEGAACGRPLIATDVPGCRDIVRDQINGFTVPVGDFSSLLEALRKLVVDRELRKRFGLAGRRIVEREFSSDKVIAQTLTLYRRLSNKSLGVHLL